MMRGSFTSFSKVPTKLRLLLPTETEMWGAIFHNNFKRTEKNYNCKFSKANALRKRRSEAKSQEEAFIGFSKAEENIVAILVSTCIL